jgi:quinol monooxygenase YgiN
MQFHSNSVNEFKETFSLAEEKIRNFAGCYALKIMQDENNPLIYSTISIWENEEALEVYRKSNLFKTTWEAAKKGFSGKPIAFTLTGDIRL